jgi:hypothetical protein
VPTTAVPAPDPNAPDATAPPTTTEAGPGITEPVGPDGAFDTGDRDPRVARVVGRVLLVVAALVVLAVLGGAGIAAWRALRRWRRRRTAVTADARVRSAWADAVEAVGVTGVVPRRHETPVEFAARARRSLGDDGVVRLAWLLEQADYAPGGVDEDAAADVLPVADAIRRTVAAQTTTRARVLAAVDPRGPDRRRGPRPTGPRVQIRRAD